MNIHNPYWEEVSGVMDAIRRDQLNASSLADQWLLRQELVKKYSWGVLSPATAETIATHLHGLRAVEVGAGNGYWSYVLKQYGVDITATDAFPPHTTGNPWYHPVEVVQGWATASDATAPRDFAEDGNYRRLVYESEYPGGVRVGDPVQYEQAIAGSTSRVWTNVEKMQAADLGATYPEADALLLCWPEMSPMAAEAVESFKGDIIVYCGESYGGCTANGDFFDAVFDSFGEIENNYRWHPRWYGLNDYMSISIRR